MIKQKKSYVFCGDNKAKKSIYLDNVISFGIGAMPINDLAVRNMLDEYKNIDVIFFSCGFPLAGCKLLDEIKKLQKVDVESRLIPDRHRQDCRGFYKDNFWKSLLAEDISFLFQNWWEMIDYFYNKYQQIVLLPLSAHYFDHVLKLPDKAMEIVSSFDRVVDLSPLDSFPEENYLG
ncbi:MAG: hypothetical protein AAGH46_10945, partial [Bacteroidota bacterium]